MLNLLFCIVTWSIIGIFIVPKIVRSMNKAFNRLQTLHQIPCSKCIYFTGDYRLKCTINPVRALSEEAIGCKDFEFNS